jgi:hypothetical protein
MTSDRTILITGVTGNQGGAVARAGNNLVCPRCVPGLCRGSCKPGPINSNFPQAGLFECFMKDPVFPSGC